jgi:hypothetical protein
MLGTIIGAVIALLLGLWLVFSALGVIVQILGGILVVVGAVWLYRGLSSRSGTNV